MITSRDDRWKQFCEGSGEQKAKDEFLEELLDSRAVHGLISQSCHAAQRPLTVRTAGPEGQVSAIVPAATPCDGYQRGLRSLAELRLSSLHHSLQGLSSVVCVLVSSSLASSKQRRVERRQV